MSAPSDTAADRAAEPAIPAIVVESLVKRYPHRPTNAVDGISFTVAYGEVFGLLGPNGAGKSTTIGVLTTRVRPTAGHVWVAGVNALRRPVDAKRWIAVVPQANNLDRSLTARQNLLFHAAYHGIGGRQAAQRADSLLRQFGLEDRAADRVDRYSGGMAQRLMIARALMHEPRVLFLDEPTTGLDPQARLFVWDQLRRLNAHGLSLVLTTHDMREAEELCHRVAIVDHGRMLALGSPDELKRMAPGENTLSLAVRLDSAQTGAQPEGLLARLRELPGITGAEREDAVASAEGGTAGPPRGQASPPAPEADPGRVVFRLYGEGDPLLVGAAARVVSDAGFDLVDIRRGRVTLEDVFIHLTGRGLR